MDQQRAGSSFVLLRLACLAATHAFAALWLLPISDRAKDAEILALRHQLAVLERQLGSRRLRFAPADGAFLAVLLLPLPRTVLRQLRLLVRPDTVLGWPRDVMRGRHAKSRRPKRPGRPRTLHSIRALVLRLVRENPNWGYRRVHGEPATLGIKLAASTVWEILKEEGIDPAPQRATTTWADFCTARPTHCRPATSSRPSPDRTAPVHPRGHRARHSPHPRPGHHRPPHRGLGRPGRPQPCHGS
jgi:transposase